MLPSAGYGSAQTRRSSHVGVAGHGADDDAVALAAYALSSGMARSTSCSGAARRSFHGCQQGLAAGQLAASAWLGQHKGVNQEAGRS